MHPKQLFPVMMNDPVSALLYLLAGMAIIYLFQVRRRFLSDLQPDQLPELTSEDYSQLILLLKTAYERMLYMGVLFVPLAISVWHGTGRIATLFFLLLIGLLFLSNIGPRHKIMRLLESCDLTMDDLKNRGIKL